MTDWLYILPPFFLSTCYVWPSYSNKSSVALKTAFELQKTLCVFFGSCNFLSFKLFVRQCTIFFTQRARHSRATFSDWTRLAFQNITSQLDNCINFLLLTVILIEFVRNPRHSITWVLWVIDFPFTH